MAMQIGYCGDDTLSDTADWSFGINLTDSATGLPLNVTGSTFSCPFRSLGDGTLVINAASGDGSNTITVPDAVNGKLWFTLRAASRSDWRAPSGGWMGFARITAVIGDLTRIPDPDASPQAREDQARITLKIRPGT